MQHEIIPIPPDVDYHHLNEDDNPTVLRVHGDTGRYVCHYFDLDIGDLGGDYDSLTDWRCVTLTRRQVSDLAQYLVGLLAARPA